MVVVRFGVSVGWRFLLLVVVGCCVFSSSVVGHRL